MEETKVQHLSGKEQESNSPRFVVKSVFQYWNMRSYVWRPPTDVFETDDAIVIKMEIAGMKDSEFTISLENRILAIRGFRESVNEHRAYYQMEVRSGEFVSLVELPTAVNYDQIEADYRDGFLTVVLPKLQPQKVDVEK